MSTGFLKVNDVKKSINKLGSLTAAIGTDSVYDRKTNKYARKRELNIIISATEGKNVIIRQAPIFDKADLDEMRADSETNKYLHIGCVTISIEPLMHKNALSPGGVGLSGYCVIVDAAFRDFGQSIISLHKYDLSSGRADFVCYPNHCLSITDANIHKRLSVMIGIEGLDVDPGTELFSLCIGYIISGVNTMHPTKIVGSPSYAISGSSTAQLEDIMPEISEMLDSSYNSSEVVCLPSEADRYLKSKGNILSNLLGNQRQIKRRTMKALPTSNISSLQMRSLSMMPSLKEKQAYGKTSSMSRLAMAAAAKRAISDHLRTVNKTKSNLMKAQDYEDEDDSGQYMD